jgi:glycerol-3-phosphate O-acyltransferase
MGTSKEFDEIRPYVDSEVEEVVERLLQTPAFYTMMEYVHPDWVEEKVREVMHEVKTIDGFQSKIAHPLMRILLDKTIDSLSISGLENIQKGESYLFISNHRDIILDSAILNVLLYEKGYGTFQTAIGSNLLSSELVSDLTKLNKNFVVKRNTGAREFYENSMILSSYIQHVIGDLKESIWIAQREGRTKDGLDKTQPGLLKMLSINCDKPVRECFRDLRITPVAISYEYDPCDVLKIPELKAISRDEKYEKAPGEDLNSILTGLTGRKGRVHIKIGKTLNKELDALADQSNINEKLKMLGEIIDRQIYLNYKIWPTNQMAFDKLENQIASSENYEGRDPEEFFNLCKERLSGANLNSPEDYNWLLNMYANPVRNYLALEEA